MVHRVTKSWTWLKQLSTHTHITALNTNAVVQLLNPVGLFVTPWTMPGTPVLHYLPEFAQTHVHWVNDAIQPSNPLLPSSLCPQSFPASESFPMSCLFASDSQSIGTNIYHLLGTHRVFGEGHGNPLQYSCVENPMDREASWLQSTGSQRIGHHWSDLARRQLPLRLSW